MSAQGAGWLGYSLDRARGRVGIRGLGDRVLLLGRQAGRMATLFAYAAAEAGSRLAVLDLDGSVSPEVHGYFRCFDYRSLLYEAFHLEGEDATHGQLVASAYAAALDLSSEEETVLSAALQRLSEQNDLATPAALYDALGAVEGFRGFYVDKLRGRVGALRLLDAARGEGFDSLASGGAMVGFSSAPYPQAADLTAGLCIAKLLHLLSSASPSPDPLLITGAHRLFKAPNRFQHSGRLLAWLLESKVPLVLATPLPALLSEQLVESVPVRVYSSEAWNARRNWKQAAALACSYVVCDDRSSASLGFVPRFIRPRHAPPPLPSGPPRRAPAELTRTILEEVSRFDSANRQSIVSYLSPQFLPADVAAEIDRLHSEGYLVLEPKQSGSGPRILAYTVSEPGRRLLQGLSG
ncbi:MAG: hypothetical protein JRN62_07520 [Nitrososphaerota archaeon]|nr:hypothetical protein [Nitrososphaerota archaeon]MDG6946802.1 hypothetical protein [Nitrososphaerota archaeon]